MADEEEPGFWEAILEKLGSVIGSGAQQGMAAMKDGHDIDIDAVSGALQDGMANAVVDAQADGGQQLAESALGPNLSLAVEMAKSYCQSEISPGGVLDKSGKGSQEIT